MIFHKLIHLCILILSAQDIWTIINTEYLQIHMCRALYLTSINKSYISYVYCFHIIVFSVMGLGLGPLM